MARRKLWNYAMKTLFGITPVPERLDGWQRLIRPWQPPLHGTPFENVVSLVPKTTN